MPHLDITELDATSLAHLIGHKQISPVEVTQAYLARMAALDPQLQAFCTPTPELALSQAHAVERAVMRGEPLGLLAGVPVAIKDLILTAGIRTTSSSFAYEHFTPEEDDIAVARLKAAGAIILGKTNASEFGYSASGHGPLFPSTRNPWNPSLTPGGSSAGSGAALAAGMCPLALGSDGGGSIRIPAALCGVFGMKASMGRVPVYPSCRDDRYPGVSSWETLEHVGPMTRTVADAALMLAVMAGPDQRDRHSLPAGDTDWLAAPHGDLKGLRIGYSADWGYAPVDPQVRAVVEAAVRVFADELGCIVESADPGFADPQDAFAALIALDSDLTGMRQMMDTLGERMSPHLRAFLQRRWTAEEFTDALRVRKQVANSLARYMQRYDLLLTPTSPVTAFPIEHHGPASIAGRSVSPSQWLAFCAPLNLSGQPAASVPAGFTANGLPVGLQIVGRHLDDALVLRASAAFEAVRPWRDAWPSLVTHLNR
jgi:aspartyl-tRNA(Asn)/glutamyl-tRNA(Gln) amidotransferase subunit A